MQVLSLTESEEARFIREICLPLTFGSKFSLGLLDDVAFLKSKHKILVTTDSVCEGIHYKSGTSPSKIAHKCLARNLSDIAAKGAKPKGYTLSIAKPSWVDAAFLEQFAKGLMLLSKKFKIPLIGGDVSSSKSPTFSANITAYGEYQGEISERKNAKLSDNIYVTGKIGRAYLGFQGVLEFLPFYETPMPQISLMRKIHKKYQINASIDVSDGFLKDLKTLLFASGCGAEIDVESIPVPPFESEKGSEFYENCLNFGDDYEIIFTSKDDIKEPNVAKIGKIVKAKTLTILGLKLDKLTLKNDGYSHF